MRDDGVQGALQVSPVGAGDKGDFAAAGFDEKDSSGSIGLISRLDDLPEEKALRGLLRQAFKIAAEERPAGAGNVLPGGAKRGKRGPAKAVKTPEDLTVELGKQDGAVATFEALSPSCRKEYVEWIEGAKRAETRARRVSKAVGWIAEGKRLNWKYEAS